MEPPMIVDSQMERFITFQLFGGALVFYLCSLWQSRKQEYLVSLIFGYCGLALDVWAAIRYFDQTVFYDLGWLTNIELISPLIMVGLAILLALSFILYKIKLTYWFGRLLPWALLIWLIALASRIF